MKILLLMLLSLGLLFSADPAKLQAAAQKAELRAQSKKNAQYRKLQDRLNEFVILWKAECAAKNQGLARTEDGALECKSIPPAAPSPKPEEKKP